MKIKCRNRVAGIADSASPQLRTLRQTLIRFGMLKKHARLGIIYAEGKNME